jgi:hypothetical protein
VKRIILPQSFFNHEKHESHEKLTAKNAESAKKGARASRPQSHLTRRGGQASELRHSRESGNPVLPKNQTSKPWYRQKRTDFVFANTSFLDSRFRGNDGARGVFFFAALREAKRWDSLRSSPAYDPATSRRKMAIFS